MNDEALSDLSRAIGELSNTVAKLRDPQDGCPWDLQQTHASLRRYLIEEAYEAVEWMNPDLGDDENRDRELAEELGDVLLQVVLHAQIAQDRGAFCLVDIVSGLSEKLVRRHPHVFNKSSSEAKTFSHQGWERIKELERREKSEIVQGQSYFSTLSNAFPASIQAEKIGKMAAKIAFDWTLVEDVWRAFQSEVSELREALVASQFKDSSEVRTELSDVYFSLAQLCRHLKLDPEVTALEGNQKFLKRFAAMEVLALQRQVDVKATSTEKLEELWQLAKKLEHR